MAGSGERVAATRADPRGQLFARVDLAAGDHHPRPTFGQAQTQA
jgi:hypothetical protein